MKETPMIFSGDHPPKVQDGTKTMTRRVIKLPGAPNHLGQWEATYLGGDGTTKDSLGNIVPRIDGIWHTRTGKFLKCPYGQVGDLLYCRETHYRWGHWAKNGFTKTGKQKWTFKAESNEVYFIDNPPCAVQRNSFRGTAWYKRPSIFMPRWASRITLEISEVRAERLWDITTEDCIAEGMFWGGAVISGFIELWDSINGKRYPWAGNWWVWVLSFKVVK